MFLLSLLHSAQCETQMWSPL